MLHRLRHAAQTESFNRPLAGEVEADETFVGGKESDKHEHKRTPGARGGKGKAAVFGMLERGGELRARKMERLTGKAMKAEIKANVKPGATLLTDEAKGYSGLDGTYHHYAVNHSAGEYVRWFFVHTNGLENAWSLFKRQVDGIHHWISDKHLDRYLGEFAFRFSRRQMGEGSRVDALIADASGRRLTYRALIA